MLAPGPFGFLAPEDCSEGRPLFRDPALQDRFDEVGYVVVPFLSSEQVVELTEGFDAIATELGGSSQPEHFNETYAEFSIIHSQPEFRRRAFRLISSVLGPAADEYLADYRPLIANFVNKLPSTGVVPTHQNFSVVDEAEARSVSVWVALVDCTTENGAMAMLDGSHRHLRGRRGMWAYHAFLGIDQGELDELLTPVEVPAGYAVILDDALVHYSPPNLTMQRRLAIQFVMIPDEAPAYWFQQVGAGEGGIETAVWEVEPEFFFEFWHGDGDERFASSVGTMLVPTPALELNALLDLVAGEQPSLPGPTQVLDESPTPEPALSSEDPAPVAVARSRQRGLRALISRLSR